MRRRTALDFLRKLAAILIVLAAVTAGIVGLMLATEGRGRWGWGVALMAATPLGIWLATLVTPEGGTTGYLDKNL